jgi:tRNA nucleotidyltransferase (CCA-adding enzyme)
MAKPTAILKEVLNEITPDESEKPLVKEVNAFLKGVREGLKKNKISAKVVLGGSFAKDTWLKGDHDVDVFVALAQKHKNDDLSGLLEKVLKPWNPERIHGSRDYFQISNGINFEIVPVLQILRPSQAGNVTDFSIKHVQWVNTKGKNLKNDIRLMKKFCKSQGVYGAESYIRGFSGHVIDLLIIQHGGFIKLLKASQKWQPKTIIDPKNTYKGKALFHLNESKTQGPLVLIDPVQPDRNAAAALVQEHYDKFIKSAKKFLDNPSKSMFVAKKVDFEKLKGQGALVVSVNSVKAKEDVAGTKLVKAFGFILNEFERHDFKVANYGWEWDKEKNAKFWFRTKEKKLSATAKRIGPPTKIEDHAKKFKKKFRTAKVVKGKLVAVVKRKYTTPQAVLKNALTNAYLKDKGKNFKIE